LDFFQDSEEPTKAVGHIGVVGVEHGLKLLFLRMAANGTVQESFDGGGTGVANVLLRPATHDGEIKKLVGIRGIGSSEDRIH